MSWKFIISKTYTAKLEMHIHFKSYISHSCIIECQSTESNASVIIYHLTSFGNEFIALDEEGK